MPVDTSLPTSWQTDTRWTAVLECGPDPDDFCRRLPTLAAAVRGAVPLVVGRLPAALAPALPDARVLTFESTGELLGRLRAAVTTPLVGFVPAGGVVGPPGG